NQRGTVIGYSEAYPGDSDVVHAYMATQAGMIDLGTWGGSSSLAHGINDRDQVVGGALDENEHLRAFLYSDGVMQDLNDLIASDARVRLLRANDINNRGQIAAFGVDLNTGEKHGYLLTPQSQGSEDRPFRGRITGSYITRPTSDPNVVLSEATAVGCGTHIGRFEKTTRDVANFATLNDEGEFTMMVADGDLLTGFYSGPLIPGDSPGTLSWRLDAVITGGTGRFRHATGEFVFVADGEYM